MNARLGAIVDREKRVRLEQKRGKNKACSWSAINAEKRVRSMRYYGVRVRWYYGVGARWSPKAFLKRVRF